MAQEEFLDIPMPDILEQWRFYLSVLSPQPDDVILDVGCNTGDAERLLVRDYPKIARVVGVEKSQLRYERAMARCQNEGTPGQIELRLADGQNLPFDKASFDRALCVETLEWMNDPMKALQEMCRVLKRGGVAAIVHTDFDTQVFSATDKKLCRQIVHSFSDAGPNGQMGRQLYALCRGAGFSAVQPLVYTLVNTEWSANMYGYQAAQMMSDWFAKKPLVTKDDVGRWLADLEEEHSRGAFFYSINRYICRCVR